MLSNLDGLAWSDLDNGYRGAWVDSRYADVPQKWLVVHSQHATKRELANLDKRIEKSVVKSEKSFKKLCRLFSRPEEKTKSKSNCTMGILLFPRNS